MVFSKDSNVTLVVTSCGRFDLLKKTLDSFEQFNTYPIRSVIITEDSGDERVKGCIPANWRDYTTFFVNNPRLGQLASIDLAYSIIETPYIFHCEDDWLFYRPEFIEDSMLLLEADAMALQVWLRSYAHDLAIHSPYVFLESRREISGVKFYTVGSRKVDWQGFSFNPGLRRFADYMMVSPYSSQKNEKDLSKYYSDKGRYALILESDAVLHTGFGGHVKVPEERLKKARRKKIDRVRNVLFFGAGVFFSSLFFLFIS